MKKKVSCKRVRARPWLTFENTVSNIREERHVKIMRTSRKGMGRVYEGLMVMDEAKEVCRDRKVWR